MGRFYKISCLIMAAVSLAALIVTLVVGVSGVSPTAASFGLFAVILCLSVTAVLTVLALFLFRVGGRLPYKIGYFILHAGLVVLIGGFILTELATQTNEKTYVDETGAERSIQGDYFAVGDPVQTVRAGKKDLLRYGELFCLDSVDFQTYEDGTPKSYEASISVLDGGSGLVKEEKTLTVNHPQYVNGFKIYLMNVMPSKSGAVLLIKYNPGEYVVLSGVALLIAGTFLACFSGFAKKRTPTPKKASGDQATSAQSGKDGEASETRKRRGGGET